MMEDAEVFVPMKLNGEIVPGYYINKLAQVKGPRGIIMKTRKNNSNYNLITIYINRQPKTVLVHRAVAETFIPNPLNLPTVNHIHGKESGDDVWNLEWATYSDNNVHALVNNLRKPLSCEDHQYATLTNDIVIRICELLEQGRNYTDIVTILKLHHIPNIRSKIKMIKTSNAWTDISKNYKFPERKMNDTVLYTDEAIAKVCELLQEGISDYGKILKMVGIPDTRTTRRMVSSVYCRRKYKRISKNYVW